MKQRLINAWEALNERYCHNDFDYTYVWVVIQKMDRIRNILIKRYNYHTKY